jgi:hypothetical protein
MVKRMGRPPIEIDQEDFEKLCVMQSTLSEIAGWFDCSVDTIERWCKRVYKCTFADIYKQKSAKGKISLRRWQWKRAESGDKTMLIWLGKQHLGQQDKQEIEHSGPDGGPIEIRSMSDDELERKAQQILSRRTGNTD